MAIEPTKPQQGIQSIEVGARLLRALAANGRSMMLRDLAQNAAMPAAKAHRYLVSFMRMGLVEQDANTGRYARLVASMSQSTQFLFISHNKIAMEMAQQLIGVTMQEQGVSRIVAVDMQAAISMAEV